MNLFMRIYFFLFCLLISLASCSKNEPSHSRIVDIDFDDGLGKGHRPFELLQKSSCDQKRHRILKKVWEQNRPAHVVSSPQTKIPKIIHQIWLGPKRPPRFFYQFRQTWEELHPDWEYRLWTDADVESYDFELKDLYNQSSNWGEKSDILRCEILQAFGGIYVDTDFEALAPFDDLVHTYDFFAGIEPPHPVPESQNVLLISNALVGTIPQHHIIKRWKEMIRNRWKQAEEECYSPIEKVMVRTFLSFGDAVEQELENSPHCSIVFPSTYFYPVKPSYLRRPVETPNVFKKMLIALDVKSAHYFSGPKKETMAIHHFAGSWQKSPQELIKDVHQDILKLKKEQARLLAEVEELKNRLPKDT